MAALFLSLLIIDTSALASQLSWLAYGDLRAYIEPCGCDPLTDMGGVRRIASFLRRERLLHPEIPVFGLGNTLPDGENDNLKIPYLLEAEAAFKPNAVLMNILELERINDLRKYSAQAPYVLSNYSGPANINFLPKVSLKKPNLMVLGYTYDQRLRNVLEQVGPRLLRQFQNVIAAERTPETRLVLLFSGSDTDLEAFNSSKIFDVIITSNVAPFNTHPDLKEKVNEDLLRRSKSADIFMVPLGGQGVLRGGLARFSQSQSLSEILQNKLQPSTSAILENNYRNVTWLGRDVGGDDEFLDLFKRYNEAAKSQFDQKAALRQRELEKSPYVGSEPCQACHQAAYQTWRNSKHASAFQTLISKNKDKDEECVKCHVLGLNERGGFVSLDLSPQFANVQCEVCHGPRKEHVKNPTIKAPRSVQSKIDCKICHNSLHSPSFEFEKYWNQIKHHF